MKINMKRLLSMLMALCMVIGMVPSLALNAHAVYQLDVNIGIDEPVVGGTPDFVGDEDAIEYYVPENGISWHNDTDDEDMSPTDTFEAGHDYTVTVRIAPNSTTENAFTDKVSVSLGEEEAEWELVDGIIIATFTFSLEAEEVYEPVDATIKVVDENGDALEDAVVYVGATEIGATDENGLVDLDDLEDGIYNVYTELSGYFSGYALMGVRNGAIVSVQNAEIDEEGNVVITMEEIPEATFTIVKNVELAAGSAEAPETTFTFEVSCQPAPEINALVEDADVVMDPEDYTFITTITVPAGETSVSKEVVLDINDEYVFYDWSDSNAVITIREVDDGAENWTYDEAVYQAAGSELAGSFTFTNTYDDPAEVPPVAPEYEEDDYSVIVKVKFDGVDEDEIDKVRAILVKNGKNYKTKPVSEKIDWEYEWTGLNDVHKWTVDAEEIEGYDMEIKNVRANYWVITISKPVAEKANPETGASDFVGAAVALAACSAVCGAALMLKRK